LVDRAGFEQHHADDAAAVEHGLMNGGEAGGSGFRDIVEADDRNVHARFQTALPNGIENAERKDVAGCEDRGRPVLPVEELDGGRVPCGAGVSGRSDRQDLQTPILPYRQGTSSYLDPVLPIHMKAEG
jgi:hypothetical protein